MSGDPVTCDDTLDAKAFMKRFTSRDHRGVAVATTRGEGDRARHKRVQGDAASVLPHAVLTPA